MLPWLGVMAAQTRVCDKPPRTCTAPRAGCQIGNPLLLGAAWVFLTPPIRLFGTVDFVRGGLQAPFDRRLRVRHAYHDLLFLALAAQLPTRSRICLA